MKRLLLVVALLLAVSLVPGAATAYQSPAAGRPSTELTHDEGPFRQVRGAHVDAMLSPALVLGAAGTSADGAPPRFQDPELLFSLDVGQDISYAGTGPEQLLWGPAAGAVTSDGTVWIADGADHRLLGYTTGGRQVAAVDLSKELVGIGDVEARGTQLVVLDIAAVVPEVLIVEPYVGEVIDRWPVPEGARLADGLSGVWVQPDGSVFAELEGGIDLRPVGLQADPTASATYNTEIGEVRITGSDHTLGGSASFLVNNHQLRVNVQNYIGTAQLIGATDSWIGLALDEVSQHPDGRIMADQTVRLIDPNGEQVGIARLPLSSFVVSVAEPVTVTPGGDIIALIPRSRRVDVVKLPVVDRLDPVLPSAAEISVALGAEDLSVGIESCVDRAVMRNTDVGYRTNSKYLSDTNINGACTYRTKPRYLGSAGTYSSVSYRWGGFDTVSNFNSHMSPATGKAGDITSGTEATCAYGVDCSGFVSRVWHGVSLHHVLSRQQQRVALSWLRQPSRVRHLRQTGESRDPLPVLLGKRLLRV